MLAIVFPIMSNKGQVIFNTHMSYDLFDVIFSGSTVKNPPVIRVDLHIFERGEAILMQ